MKFACAIIHIDEKKRKASECIIWGKVSNRMCLLGATHNVWCSMASYSAAVVGATVVGAAAVGPVVFGAA